MKKPKGRLLDDLALPAEFDPDTIGRIIGRYPSSSWLDMLARRASRGRLSASQLVRQVREGGLPRGDASALAMFAWLTATVATSPDDLHDSLALYDAAFSTSKTAPRVPEAVYNTWLRILALTGTLQTADKVPPREKVLEADWWAAHTDLLNPSVSGGPVDAWLSAFNMPFQDAGLVPLELLDTEGSLLSRLHGGPAAEVDGPLISVIMPVFDPDETLLVAVRSILGQTWQNIEVLIVNDASRVGLEHFAEAESLDERVRIIHAPRNGGAYPARNLGMAAATGEFLTFQDADDFSHPQRLERHVNAILEHDAVAAVSRGVRATDDLMITTLGFRHISINLSSLLFRREAVLRHLGMYDPVRRGADSEFSYRIQSVFGRESMERLMYPLAVLRLTPGSLSGGEVGLLQRHPARVSYRAAAQAWHEGQDRAGKDPYVFPPNRPPFPSPPHIRGTDNEDVASHRDVLLLTSLEAGVTYDSAGVVGALTSTGVSVAVREHFGPSAAVHKLRESQNTLGAHLADGSAYWALPGQEVHAPITFVHDPLSILAMPAERIDTHHIVLVLETDLSPESIRVIDGRLRLSEASRVSWLPATEHLAEHLHRAHPAAEALPPAWWRLPTVTRARSHFQPGPVGIVDQAYTSASVPSELLPSMGSLRVFGRPIGDLSKSSYTRIPARISSWEPFLAGVSALIHPHTTSITPVLIDAWHSGTVVIAPPSMETLLGEKSLYTENTDVLLEQLESDSRSASTAIGISQEYCDSHLSPMAINSLLTALTLETHE